MRRVRECVEQWLEKRLPKKFDTFEEVEKLWRLDPWAASIAAVAGVASRQVASQ
jgi:hypothetical protein